MYPPPLPISKGCGIHKQLVCTMSTSAADQTRAITSKRAGPSETCPPSHSSGRVSLPS